MNGNMCAFLPDVKHADTYEDDAYVHIYSGAFTKILRELCTPFVNLDLGNTPGYSRIENEIRL